MIDRRIFVQTMTVGTLILAYGRAASAQVPARPPKLGFLHGGSVPTNAAALMDGLREQGYVPGENLVVDHRVPERGKFEQLSALAAGLVAGQPDVIAAANPHSIDALSKLTKTIPIVGIDLESDPVARGWVASLARPGGNITGFFMDLPEISGKQLQFLRELAPTLRRVGVLGAPGVNEPQFLAIEGAARQIGVTLHLRRITTLGQIAGAVADLARQRAEGLVALTSPLILAGASAIAEEAIRYQLPTICPFVPFFAERGGLIAYGPDLPDLFRRAGGYVARILRGARAAELPLQRPEKFALVVNLRTARILKLTAPPPLLARADRVIE